MPRPGSCVARVAVLLHATMLARGSPAGTSLPGPVVLVGIDSATWRVIDRLVAEGDLPTFRRLRDGGVSGEIHTLVPTYSPTIWTTMVTGVVPSIHGITATPEDGVQPLTSDCRRVPALWEMLEESCLRTNVLNYWCTWPAEPILGNMVSERYRWRELGHRVSPGAILIVHGPMARGPSIRLEGPSVVDIAPTILSMLGVAPPPALAGCLLEGAVSDDVIVRARSLSSRSYRRRAPTVAPNPEHVRRSVEEELRSLGYLR